MLETFNFYFSSQYAVQIWLIFSLLLSSFVLFYNNKIKLIEESFESFNNKINYYICLFIFSIMLSFWKLIYILFSSFSDLPNMVTIKLEIMLFLTSLSYLDWLKIFFLFISIYFFYLLKIYIKIDKKILNVEILILLSFSILGLFLILVSPDFIWFYLSLELYSLSVYCFLFIFNYSSLNSSIKYFVVGSISSLILLFSLTVIYFYTGTLEMEKLFIFFYNFDYVDVSDSVAYVHKIFFLIFGLGLFLTSFALKLGLAPLHAWSVDVYSSQSYYCTFFLLILPKLTFITFLINFFYCTTPVLMNNKFFYYIILLFSVLSVLTGTLGTINQTNIKKIFLYSSLGNIIFLFMPLLNPSSETLANYFVFSFFYFINLIIILTILLYVKDLSSGNPIKKIDHLSSLYKSHPYLSVLLSFCLLSLSGIPPFIGFYTKFYFLQTLFSLSLILFIFVLVCNSIMFFYSLRIIKLIFFNDSSRISLLPNISWKFASLMLFLTVLLNILSVFYLSTIYSLAHFFIFII